MNITKINRADTQQQINFYNKRGIYNATRSHTADKFVKNSRHWISDILALSEHTLPKKREYTKSDYRKIGLYEYIRKNKQIFINMLNFENISDQNQSETFAFIHNQVQQTKKRMKEERHSNNFIDSIKNTFIPQVVRNRSEVEYYKEEGVYLFIKENLNNFKLFLNNIPTYKSNPVKSTQLKEPAKDFPILPIETPKQQTEITQPINTLIEPPVEPAVIKPHWQVYNELEAEKDRLHKQFIAMDYNSDRSDVQEKLSKAAYALSDFKEKAKRENFSLLEKKDLSSASENERWDYFINYAFPLMQNNEATAFDCIEMFDKFGMRKYFKRHEKAVQLNTSLEELMSYTPDEPSDKLISGLFDVIHKYAVPNNKNDDLDVAMLRYILTNYDRYHLYKNISEDSLLKAIDLFKKMEFWNTKSGHIPNDIKIRYIDRKFKDSPRLNEIKEAVNEMKNLWNSNNPEMAV